MFHLHNILFPTDFSERSAIAFQLASALARDYNAGLVVLHVAQPPVVLYAEGIIPNPPPDQTEKIHEQLLRYQIEDADCHVTHLLEEGNPGAEILRIASQVSADLIVMGTHGRHGLKRLFMGSVAEYVLERASCPVLTVKNPFPSDEPHADVVVEASAHR